MDLQENKLIIIEGVQGSGKTHLINSLPDNYLKFKFSVTKINNLINNKDRKFKTGMSIGRDLTILKLFKHLNKPIIMDRGILSSIVWDYLDGETEDIMFEYIPYINYLVFEKDIYTIIIHGFNPYFYRNRNDGYDKFNREDQRQTYLRFIKELSLLKVFHFENNFDRESEIHFKYLIEDILYGEQS